MGDTRKHPPETAMTPPPVASAARLTGALSASLADALRTGDLDPLWGAQPVDRRDRFLTLLSVYDLHTAPLEVVGDAARHQGHPAVAEIKARLEREWVAELEATPADHGDEDPSTPDGAVSAMRWVAVTERIPQAYRWLATDADWDQLVHFLAVEGGPDGGFDDLVAACQVGLHGSAKLELAQNYWDEMGNGSLDAIHTVLHDRLVEAIGMPRIPREELGVEALERAALGGLLATNRWLQPEMVGALGLLELQAGPRCRMVLKAFDRLGAPEAAYPFYVEHAEVDPRHGKDWVEKAVAPLVAEHPAWGPRIVRGAEWRAAVNLRFFEAAREDLCGGVRPAA